MTYDPSHFDERYRAGDGDPWDYYESTYEATKYDRTLAAAVERVASEDVTRILELGCGNGAFTGRLVETYPDAEVTGVDHSTVALEEARTRVDGAEFVAADLTTFVEETTVEYDLVFASECLYYVADDHSITEFIRFADRLSQLLAADGAFLSANIHRPGDGEPLGGDERILHAIRTVFEDHLELRGRQRYTEVKSTGGDPRTHSYELWTFSHADNSE